MAHTYLKVHGWASHWKNVHCIRFKDWSKDRTRNICRHVSSMQKKVFLSFFTFNNLYACLVMKIVKKHITSTNHVHFNNNAAIVWHAIGWDVAILAYPSFVHKFQYNVQDHYNLKNCNQTFWEWECSRYFWRFIYYL